MKILLDECVTHDLRPMLTGHDVATVAYMQWSGVRNGQLLQLAANAGFEALITTDAGMEDQHAPDSLPISIVILHPKSSRIADIAPLVNECLAVLSQIQTIGIYHVR